MDIPNKLDELEPTWTKEDLWNNFGNADIDHLLDEVDELVDRINSDKVDIRTKHDICWEHVPFVTIRTFVAVPDMFHMWVELIFCDNPVEAVNQFDWDNPATKDNWDMLVQMPIAIH